MRFRFHWRRCSCRGRCWRGEFGAEMQSVDIRCVSILLLSTLSFPINLFVLYWTNIMEHLCLFSVPEITPRQSLAFRSFYYRDNKLTNNIFSDMIQKSNKISCLATFFIRNKTDKEGDCNLKDITISDRMLNKPFKSGNFQTDLLTYH